MGAVERVFAVVELLEAILIDVPLFDLVLATSVSHAFNDTIFSSTILRNRLYREPTPVFVRSRPQEPESEDICNVDDTTPWFFRSPVDDGVVIVLHLESFKIHLFVPNAKQTAIAMLDSRQTKV